MNVKDKKEFVDIMDKIVGQYYDLEVIVDNHILKNISMHPNDLKQTHLKKYKHVKLLDINGFGVGQAHFITNNGKYLLLPWCYIVSIIPSESTIF